MKKICFSFCILITMAMFSMVSYAGQWKQDDMGFWYQNEDGTYITGWYQDINGKWYYFDEQTGYMLSDTTTPDGYIVNENGEWIEGMENTLFYDGNLYKNKAEFEVSAYGSRGTIKKFDDTLPVTVYYNDEYVSDNVKVKITNMGLSKDGVLYAEYEVNKEAYAYPYGFKTTVLFKLEDGTCVTSKSRKMSVYINGKSTDSSELLPDPEDVKPISAEVYIDVEKI